MASITYNPLFTPNQAPPTQEVEETWIYGSPKLLPPPPVIKESKSETSTLSYLFHKICSIRIAPDPFIPRGPSIKEIPANASSYERTLLYLHNVKEKTLFMEGESTLSAREVREKRGLMPRKVDELGLLDRFINHQQMISKDPISYLISGERFSDGRKYHIIRRIGDIAFGSTLEVILGIVPKILKLIEATPALVFFSLGAAIKRIFNGAWDDNLQLSIKISLERVLPLVYNIARDTLRVIPVAGHFLGKAYDIQCILVQDAASVIYTRIKSAIASATPSQTDGKDLNAPILTV